jgi:5-methyltetrahydropteroyltriglutamate--homocysteine methyltransferase
MPAGRLMVNPDCGLRHLAPAVARRKLRAMVAGAAIVRAELGLTGPALTGPALTGPALTGSCLTGEEPVPVQSQNQASP